MLLVSGQQVPSAINPDHPGFIPAPQFPFQVLTTTSVSTIFDTHFDVFIYEFLKLLHGVVDLTSSFESSNLKKATRFLFAWMVNIGWMDIISTRLEDQHHILIDDAHLAGTWREAARSQADARGLVEFFLEGYRLWNANNNYNVQVGVL